MKQLDITLFHWINTQFQFHLLAAFMMFITDVTHFILPGVLIVIYLIAAFKWKGFWFVILTLITILFNDALCYNILKPLFSRPRPCQDLIDVIIYSRCSTNYSFPSNHASNIFTLATLFAGVYKHTLLLSFTIAILVGTSRIYLGVHYPTDILGGAVIGISMGLLGVHLYNKIVAKSFL